MNASLKVLCINNVVFLELATFHHKEHASEKEAQSQLHVQFSMVL